MNNKAAAILSFIFFCSNAVYAQVPVREEPRHHPVLENKYLRLLDVWLPPGDTSLFHIHATPSVFLYLSNNAIASQIKGQGWVKDISVAGKSWYRSFSPEILVHRVSNLDSMPFHVNDIELLLPYGSNHFSAKKLFPFTLLYENEKAFAYQVTDRSFNKVVIKDRGPIIAALAQGEVLLFHDTKTKQLKKIKAGEYLYVEPGASFYFSGAGSGKINLVLFEIK